MRKVSHPVPLIVCGIWMAAVTFALASTLGSLRTDDFDGLNNLWQIPLALPWFLLTPVLASGYRSQAWVDAGWGVVNGVLIYLLARAWAGRDRPAGARDAVPEP